MNGECSSADWEVIISGSNLEKAIAFALYEGKAADTAFDYFMVKLSSTVNITGNTCIGCVNASIASFTQTDARSACIANPASSNCMKSLAVMASDLAVCSDQERTSLSFFEVCSSSEFLTFTGTVLTELSDVLYRAVQPP